MTTLRLLPGFMLLCASTGLTQPLNGSYTVGGSAPDFVTPQAAASALFARGVSGPVVFNLRPGTYNENGGSSPVLAIDSLVTGVSSFNRITFQPDAPSGGTVDNVILQVDQSAQNDASAVIIKSDFVTLSNLTIQDADTGDSESPSLVLVQRIFPSNMIVEGTLIEGCRLLGNPVNNRLEGTNRGIFGGNLEDIGDIVIRGNTFHRCMTAIEVGNVSSSRTITIEDNNIFEGHIGTSPIGAGIVANAESVFVRGNIIDNSGSDGSHRGILVLAVIGFIEQNHIRNTDGANFGFSGIRVGPPSPLTTRSILIANNIISGNYAHGGTRIGIDVTTSNVKIIHNTIVNPERVQVTRGIDFNSSFLDSCTVLNNIIIDHGLEVPGRVASVVAFDHRNNTAGLVSDYNVFYRPGGNQSFFVCSNGVCYGDFADYQSETGFDVNSHVESIDFPGDPDDLHLDDCQAQSPSLVGTPVPEVPIDIDGESRSLIAPTIGADEAAGSAHDLFGDPVRIFNGGAAFSADADLLFNIVASELAFPEWDGHQIRVFEYHDPRSYTETPAWPTVDCQPTILKIADMDDDGDKDFVISCQNFPLSVYYLDGVGSSGFMSAVDTGSVVSIEVADVDLDGLPDIVGTRGGLAVFVNNGGTNYDPFVFPSTFNFPGDLVVRDLNGDSFPDVITTAVTPLPPKISVYLNLGLSGGAWQGFGQENEYFFQTGNLTDASSIADGDFDGDGDIDLICTHAASDTLIFLLNNGDATFERQTIPDITHKVVAPLDYDNDGDVDLTVGHFDMARDGFTVYFNDGQGNFQKKQNCFVSSLVNGVPQSMVSKHLDFDALPDLIITTVDSVFVLFNLGGTAVAVAQQGSPGFPESFSLSQNYPNPFNPSTTIGFELPEAGHVQLKIYDVLGREVTTLLNTERHGGRHRVTWDGNNMLGQRVSSGVYLYRLETRGDDGQSRYVNVKKMVIMK